MTIDQMRAILGLDESVSDEDVAAAYAAFLLSQSPAAEPLTVAEAKEQLGLTEDETADDPRIGNLIIAARGYVENYTGLILTAREMVETRDCFGPWIELYSWPIRAITGIEYIDTAGAAQTLDPAAYSGALGRRPARLVSSIGTIWPVTSRIPGSITITVQAGFASPDQVPQDVKHAMLLMIRHWFDNASAVVVGGSGAAALEVPLGVAAILDFHRARIC